MIGCFAYLTNSFTALAFPQYEDIVSRWASPLQAVELLFMFWLLIMGARPKPQPKCVSCDCLNEVPAVDGATIFLQFGKPKLLMDCECNRDVMPTIRPAGVIPAHPRTIVTSYNSPPLGCDRRGTS
jgi:hypothetical protein